MVEEFVARMSFNLDETQELLLATRSSSFQEARVDGPNCLSPSSANSSLGVFAPETRGVVVHVREIANAIPFEP